MLEVKNLSFSYAKNNPAIKDISFQIKEGNVLVLLGPNGSGKTTIIKCLLGLNKANENSIILNDVDVSKLKINERAKLFSYVSQENVFASLNVFDTVLLGRLPYTNIYESDEDKGKTLKTLEKFHLLPLKDKNINEISGGEKQRVMIAKAFNQDTPVIVFDEPMNNLDITYQMELLEEVKNLAKNENKIIVISIHDINTALDIGDQFLFIKNGEILSLGDEFTVNEDVILKTFNINTKQMKDKNRRLFVYEKND